MQRRLQSAAAADVTEEELRAMFEQARGQIGQRPRLISFDQVVVAPAPSEVVLEAARAEAAALLVRIRAGEDFAELATQYSADVGSAPLGGELGWFRRGSMVQEFEDAAFGLLDGQVSEPIKTVYGYHLIKVERSRSGERRGRHILIQPVTDPEDLLRGRAQADTVATLARAGTPMSELYARYSDDEAPDSLTNIPYEQLDSLPPGYSQLSTAAVGEVVGPLEYEPAPGQTRLAIVRVRAIREAGEFTFEDLRPQLTQQLQRTKQIQRILDNLKASTYVEIRLQQEE
jgi:peptidyl-prolyl cis-trans isomerase SurA